MTGLAPAVLTALLAGGAARPLTSDEEVGKAIYLGGESPRGGAIQARIGADATVPGSAVACASCHGEDGLGRPEGVVRPSLVTWSELTKRYGHVHDDGRRHPAYDERTIARAIEHGIDPAGNALDPAMPRFSLSRRDLRSLVAYLRRLEHDLDPGIDARSVRIGTIFPAASRGDGTGAAIRQVLAARLDALNAGGGVNGRRLELVAAEHDGSAASCLAAARRLVEQELTFAIVASFCPAAEAELAALAERLRVPLVGPLTPFTGQVGALPDRYVFYLVSGVREHAEALVDYAAADLGLAAPSAAIVHATDERLADAARAAASQARRRGWTRVAVVSHPRGALGAGHVAALRADGVEVVLFLGGDADLASFTRAAAPLEFRPRVLVSGYLAARAAAEAPRAFEGELLLASSAVPSDETAAARAELAGPTPGVPDAHRGARVAAHGAAAVLVEALRRSGRHLSRERLVDQLEALHEFEPGLVPPVSYGRNRHVGTRGAYVVAVDRVAGAFRPVRWVGLE
jgi:ABC-type branched-subunit amino acid transport system substrate-binding protein